MFIDCAKLEKILKADYKSWGVKFGLTEKGMYILNGTGWMIEADKEKITNNQDMRSCTGKGRVHDVSERARSTVRNGKKAAPVGHGRRHKESLYFANQNHAA